MKTESQVREKIDSLQKQMSYLQEEHHKEIEEAKVKFKRETPSHMAAISNFYQKRISSLNDKILILKWVIDEEE